VVRRRLYAVTNSSNCLGVAEKKPVEKRSKRKRRKRSCNPISSYVILCFLLSWGLWAPLMLLNISFYAHIWKLLYVAGLSGPLFAAATVSIVTGGTPALKDLLSRACIWRAPAVLYVIAIGLSPLLMGIAWGFSAEMGERHGTWIIPSLAMLPVTFLIMALRGGPLNEEIGWRGFLLPHLLRKHTPFRASLILGGIWGAWHIPLWFLNGLPHPTWPYGLFLLLVLSCTFLFTWLHLKSGGSVLLAILFHSSINTGIHYFPILPPRHPSLVPFVWWVGLTCVAAGIVILKERRLWFSRSPEPIIVEGLVQAIPEPAAEGVEAHVERRDELGTA
jgi:membrane protease YdiL (CAAX protease family)